MKIRWSAEAADDLNNIEQRIRQDNPTTARRRQDSLRGHHGAEKVSRPWTRRTRGRESRAGLHSAPLHCGLSRDRERRRDFADLARSAGLAVIPSERLKILCPGVEWSIPGDRLSSLPE